MKNVIAAEHLSKRYLIGQQVRRDMLREVIADNVRSLGRRLSRPFERFSAVGTEEFWALRDISFEVKQGERIGIIGRNGAGKSTLLKILSRITEPTTGRVTIKGRVASLLEVGTGFHPELTGRENIFLNGAILGMTKAEINRKFDAIVAFSEVEKFIDTPVKRYSSGMYVRLAFSVAAHLDPEILIVDEVLAVGDASFQKKCLGMMGEVSKKGRTVLFVSHNMGAISQLCTRTIVLDRGMIAFSGTKEEAISFYINEGSQKTEGKVDLKEAERPHDVKGKLLTGISLHRTDGQESSEFETGKDIVVRIEYETDRPLLSYCALHFYNHMGEIILSVRNRHAATSLPIQGRGYIQCGLPANRLLSGEYSIMPVIGIGTPVEDWIDYVPNAIKFHISVGDYLGGMDWPNGRGHGYIAQKTTWSVHEDVRPVKD